jgi:anti-sigma regulatory factor (Ser/Thr protein kinase)
VIAAESKGEHVQELAPVADSVPVARRFATTAAGSLMAEDQRCNLELAVTEVFTNAVRHGGTDADIRLALTPKDGYMCVQVTDSGAGLVPKPGAIGADDEGGYGLFFVERLTRRWGVTRENSRTRVWFEVDFDQAAA